MSAAQHNNKSLYNGVLGLMVSLCTGRLPFLHAKGGHAPALNPPKLCATDSNAARATAMKITFLLSILQDSK